MYAFIQTGSRSTPRMDTLHHTVDTCALQINFFVVASLPTAAEDREPFRPAVPDNTSSIIGECLRCGDYVAMLD